MRRLGFAGVAAALLLPLLLTACGGGGGGNDDVIADTGRDAVAPADVPDELSDALAPADGDPGAPDVGTDALSPDVVEPPRLWRVRPLGAGTRTLRGASCVAPGDCWAVGDEGLLLRARGEGWMPLRSGTDVMLEAVVALPGGAAVAVGADGTVLRVRAGLVEALCTDAACRDLLPAEDADLHGVWGASDETFFAVGDAGLVLRYEGGAWHKEPTGITSTLRTAFGTSASDLFVGGDAGKVLRRVGTTWEARQVLPSDEQVLGLWGTALDTVFLVGSRGQVQRLQGAQWESQATNDTYERTLRAVWGAAENRVFATGDDGVVLFWNGTKWNLQDVDGPNAKGATFHAIAGAVDEEGELAVTLLGEAGAALGRNDDRSWTDRVAGPAGTLWGLWGEEGSDTLVAVGDDGAILEGRFDGAAPLSLVESGVRTTLRAVSGAGDGLWVVGDGATTLRRDGDSWSVVAADEALAGDLYGVTATGPDAALAVGDVGLALRFDGTTWRREETGLLARLTDVWGSRLDDAWAVAEDGSILRRTAAGWAIVDQPVGSPLRAVFGEGDTIYVAGDNGIVLRGGAAGFTLVHEASGTFLYDLDGTGDGPLLVAVGWAGGVLTSVGGADFDTPDTGTYQELRGVHVWPGGAAAVGRMGVFLERTAPWEVTP